MLGSLARISFRTELPPRNDVPRSPRSGVPEEVEVLHVEGVVQVKLLADSLNVLGGVSVFFADNGCERVSGRESEDGKDNQGDSQESREYQQQSSECVD